MNITIDQQYYIETLQDVDIPTERFHDSNLDLLPKDINACRTALGALQCLALRARCNILMSELMSNKKMITAREIQQVISEVCRNSARLHFQSFEDAKTWRDIVFVTMGDSAHANRPGGDSAGGHITLAAGPEVVKGNVVNMSKISWRSWKLKRKAISSNDSEVKALVEAEDANFRIRLLWAELHGVGVHHDGRAALDDFAEATVKKITGMVCADSRGGSDAVQLHESPLLG